MLFTHSETLISQSPTALPRTGMVWSASRARSLFSRAGGAIRRYLEGVGEARTNREVRLLATHWANTDPELASQMHTAGTCDARSQAARASRELRLLAAR